MSLISGPHPLCSGIIGSFGKALKKKACISQSDYGKTGISEAQPEEEEIRRAWGEVFAGDG